jgi:hypothetical protein
MHAYRAAPRRPSPESLTPTGPATPARSPNAVPTIAYAAAVNDASRQCLAQQRKRSVDASDARKADAADHPPLTQQNFHGFQTFAMRPGAHRGSQPS